MSTQERIAMIRLLEHLEKHPAYAAALGVEGRLKAVASERSMRKCK